MTSLQAVTVLLGIVDALDNHYFADIEGIGPKQINDARQALAVLMREVGPPTCECSVCDGTLGTANGAGGSEIRPNAGMVIDHFFEGDLEDRCYSCGFEEAASCHVYDCRKPRTANGAGGSSSGTPDGQKERNIKL